MPNTDVELRRRKMRITHSTRAHAAVPALPQYERLRDTEEAVQRKVDHAVPLLGAHGGEDGLKRGTSGGTRHDCQLKRTRAGSPGTCSESRMDTRSPGDARTSPGRRSLR